MPFGKPTAMRAVIATGAAGATLPALEGDPVGAVRLGDASIDVHQVAPGVLALDLPVEGPVRVFVHAPDWSEALESAMSTDPDPEEPVVIEAEIVPADGEGSNGAEGGQR